MPDAVAAEWPAQRVTMRAVESLVPYSLNARTHSDAQVDQIVRSIQEWGWTNPILIDEQNKIIAGHGRFLAARKLEYENVPTMQAIGWTAEQIRAYVIADNKLALNAGWNEEMLAAELIALDDAGFDATLIGFNEEEFHRIMSGDPSSTDGAGGTQIVGDDRLLVIVEFPRTQERAHGELFEELQRRGLQVKVVA